MNDPIKEAFKSEFYITTAVKKPEFLLWHGLGMHICKESISIFNANVAKISEFGYKPVYVADIRAELKAFGFVKVKDLGCVKAREIWKAPSNMASYDKALQILEKYDVKMNPETKKTCY